ncbi:MAG TPA: hypothetical protein VFM99_07615 [Chitinophagales bacterium]|nr:hypothetical protein [Chitinophagales bacterium]
MKLLMQATIGNSFAYAPDAIYASKLFNAADISVFKQTDKQKGEALTAKKSHKKLLQQHYGPGWKRHLNTPDKSIEKPIHFSF